MPIKQTLTLLLALGLTGCIVDTPDPAASPDHPANPDSPDAPRPPRSNTLDTRPTTAPATTRPAPAADHSHHGGHH